MAYYLISFIKLLNNNQLVHTCCSCCFLSYLLKCFGSFHACDYFPTRKLKYMTWQCILDMFAIKYENDECVKQLKYEYTIPYYSVLEIRSKIYVYLCRMCIICYQCYIENSRRTFGFTHDQFVKTLTQHVIENKLCTSMK